MAVRQGITTRALMDLTIGSQQAMRAREKRDREMGLSELEQQFQLEFQGTTGTLWAFRNVNITFEFPFYYAPGQRDSDFDRPQFWYGVEVDVAIAATACVIGWDFDEDNGAVIGATVAIGVVHSIAVAFKGTMHLTFQGFSALAEDEVDLADVG